MKLILRFNSVYSGRGKYSLNNRPDQKCACVINECSRNQKTSYALWLWLLLAVGLLTRVGIAQPIREYPPSLPRAFGDRRDIPLNGGRVQSIAVSPINRDRIIAAHQFGGLWQSIDGGQTWVHLNGLQEVW